MLFSTTLLGLALATARLASAQTYTDCNPTNKTCTPDTGLDSWTVTTNFTYGKSAFSKSWTAASGTTMTYGDKGAIFNITTETDAPTIETDFYIFFGKVEVTMQAAPGTGIISSIVLESDDLDEIDWEILGGNTTSCETNYFGKGNTTSYDRAIYYAVDSPQTEMHTYTVDWTAAWIKWYIDGKLVRTLDYDDANNGEDFPQTPVRVKIGSWDGGASTEAEGTIEWAGGETDIDDGPFLMYVEAITITNYNPARSYNWTDMTGSYDSISASNSSTSGNLNTTSGTATATASASVATYSDGSVATVSTITTSTGSSFSQSTSTSAASSMEFTFSLACIVAFIVGFSLI
ncbi:hypothetical protein MBLNU459_g4846t1 [Dothideomycetes sp. NU459]